MICVTQTESGRYPRMKKNHLLLPLLAMALGGCAYNYGVPTAYTPDGQAAAYSFGQHPVGLAPGMPLVYATPVVWQPMPVMVSQPVVSVPTAGQPNLSPTISGPAPRVGYPK